MFFIAVLLWFLCAFSFVLGLFPLEMEARPTLQAFGYELRPTKKRKNPLAIVRSVAMFNRPFVGSGQLREKILRELSMAHVNLTPEEFWLFKEISIVAMLIFTYPLVEPDYMVIWLLLCVFFGYMLPEYWLRGKIKKVKGIIMKELPDAVDLLGLCVNAGLDFMLALKWVVEKSPPSVMVSELNILLQEINVGKTRRDALKALSAKYDLADLATFTRTLIQADKMGTSVSEALTILSEDMRLARYRRGEQLAMKAPMKLLVPLLFFIFPVVGILVGGPIFIQFMTENPMSRMTG
ncbi:MAG TPA: type II secretion system F family protein [Candidatus Omnitrophota bacterium]|nr:type II secretion system F family protein [Candidatus Omnitrophota bacterium]HSA30221.1 type II secretion system F family protein [Candidatus Omnitrophota bacterium]